MTTAAPARSGWWKWQVCGLLLLATMLNYMDRLTVNQTALRIMEEFSLDERGYGLLESTFSLAFAFGALAAGWMVDRWNVWWIYPTAVLAWSAAGFSTGLVQTVELLFLTRLLLGLMESGHWPCALRTTQRLLPPEQRTLGNSILQSGAALGAVFTPLIVLGLVTWTDSWRPPFLVIGALGGVWVALWLVLVRREDLALAPAPAPQETRGHMSVAAVFRDRRFWVLAVVVASINSAWHFFRVWLPLYLQKVQEYSETEANLFMSSYYLATDAGALTAGFATLWLARKGVSIHRSRLAVFFACALLTTLSLVAAQLPAGPLLLLVFLIIGFAALGLFPPFYSFSQELTVRHQGKVTGTLGFISWVSVAIVQWLVGESVTQTGSYALGLSLAGLTPLVAFLAVWLFWGKSQPQAA
jgi:ACS family hexuronate transporter-like MFS transporter